MLKRPWYHMGARFLIAAFAGFILLCSLISAESKYDDNHNTTSIQIRHEPNLILGTFAIYLLGVATKFDLTEPFRVITGKRLHATEDNVENNKDE